MLQIHEEEHRVNQLLKGQRGASDTIKVVGDSFIEGVSVLCIDEFRVLDIADAMILKRLFMSFLKNKTLVFLTSNRPVDDLYLNGLQRYLFMPFIDLIKERCDLINLSAMDYRTLNLPNEGHYFYPFGSQTSQNVENKWNELSEGNPGEKMIIKVP